MASGLGQVQSLSFVGPRRAVVKLVVGTQLLAGGTEIFVVDPPDGERKARHKGRAKAVVLENNETLETDLAATVDSRLLRWAGQFSLADELLTKVGVVTPPTERPPDRDLESRLLSNLEFVGATSAAFPELGKASPRVFRGIRSDRYDSIRQRSHFERKVAATLSETETTLSIGKDDTCLAIEM